MLAAISATCAAKILAPSNGLQGHVESMIGAGPRLHRSPPARQGPNLEAPHWKVGQSAKLVWESVSLSG